MIADRPANVTRSPAPGSGGERTSCEPEGKKEGRASATEDLRRDKYTVLPIL
jgi:hypothetical protein